MWMGGGGGGGVWTCINILLVPVFQIAWECMVLKNQDISKFEMDGGGGGGVICVHMYMDVCLELESVFQIAWRCMVLKSQDISKFQMDEGEGYGHVLI